MEKITFTKIKPLRKWIDYHFRYYDNTDILVKAAARIQTEGSVEYKYKGNIALITPEPSQSSGN